MPDIQTQVEEILRALERRIVYVRHGVGRDLVFFVCSDCVEGEHEEIVPSGERPKLKCPWSER